MLHRKWNPNRILTLVLALAVLLCASQAFALKWGRGIQGSGDLETREIDVKGFDEVALHGAFDVDIRVGKKQMLKVTIDDNLWDNLVAEVEDGALDLGWEKNCRPDDDCRIEITVPDLKAFQLRGAGDVEIEGLDGGSFTFTLSGAGDVDLHGSVKELTVRLSGAGDIDARELKADHVDVKVSGAGDATVYAAQSIEGRVSGVGNLTYYGDPEERDTHVSGIGSIKRK